MSDPTDTDNPSARVKAALGRRMPVSLEVIEGGKPPASTKKGRGKKAADAGEGNGGPLTRRSAPPSPSSGEGESRGRGEGDDHAGDSGTDRESHGPFSPGDEHDSPPPSDPAEIERARECAFLDQNDLGNAQRMVTHFGDDLAYVAGLGWLVWCGTHWVRDEGELLASRYAHQVVDKIKIEAGLLDHSDAAARLIAAAQGAARKPASEMSAADRQLIAKAEALDKALGERRSKRRAFAVTSGNRGRTVAMLAQGQSLRQTPAELLDADRMLFNVPNGTLRFSRVPDPEAPFPDEPSASGPGRPVDGAPPEGAGQRLTGAVTFTPHERADMATKCAGAAYDPEAECPLWLGFLARVQPDEAMRRFLQVSTAYALLIGGNPEQVVFYHYGQGANGKSVFTEAVGGVAGSYRTTVPAETFTGDQQKQGQQASPDIARLHNTRLVTVEELPRGTPLKEGLIKAASGGSKMVARFLMKEFFEFEPQFVALMTGNELPEVSGTDHGIWRRLHIVPWMEQLPVEEQDRHLGEKLKAEGPGILNWLIDGLVTYLAQGLTPLVPAKVREFTESYREERDPVGEFAKACIARTVGAKVQANKVYAAYSDWCAMNGLKPWQQTRFGMRMNDMGFPKDKGRVYVYRNMELVNPPRLDEVPGP